MKIAITGMIGSGKSAVLKALRGLGWLTISADRVADEVAVSEEGRAFLRGSFNGDEPSRGELRERFLADADFRQGWEGFVHPRVEAQIARRFLAQPGAFWAVEVPLLFEKKLEKAYDKVVVCHCRLELALFRWEAKERSKDLYLSLSKLLIPLEEKLARADFALENSSTPEHLRRQVEKIHQKLLSQK